jgi:murein DD-endopeptidase MepM/ murein hydrolase activator NlpD
MYNLGHMLEVSGVRWSKLPLLAILLGFVTGVVACAGSVPAGSTATVSVPRMKTANSILTILPTSIIDQGTEIPPDPPEITGQPAESTSTPVISPTRPPATQPAFAICSPLSIHPIEELPEIISDPYHPPPPGKEERHQGVDFSYYRRGERLSIRGVGVQSVLSGSVAMALAETFPYGNVIIVETPQELLPVDLAQYLGINPGEALYVLYAHLENPPEVESGQQVTACQPLGAVGMSGNAGVPHLHIETRIGPAGTRFGGMRFYDTLDTQQERDNYLLWRTSGVYRHFNPMDLLLYQLSP